MDRLRRHVIAGRVDIPFGDRRHRLRSAPGFALPSARCGRSRHTAGFKREGRQHEFLFARHTVVGHVALATGMGRTDARAEGRSKQVGTGTRSCRVLRESQDVLDDHDLSPAQKRDVLRRWALDAYLIELALFKGEPQSEPSRLDEVIDALFDLDEMQASTSAYRTRATGPDCEGRAA